MRQTTRQQPACIGDTILNSATGVIGRVIALGQLPAVYRIVRERDKVEGWTGCGGQHRHIIVVEPAES